MELLSHKSIFSSSLCLSSDTFHHKIMISCETVFVTVGCKMLTVMPYRKKKEKIILHRLVCHPNMQALTLNQIIDIHMLKPV